MIRALVRKTSTCLVVTSMIFAAQSPAQADVFDSFDSANSINPIRPVSAWIDDCTSSLDFGSTCETCNTCEPICDCCCDCPPAPTMIGDSLGIPHVIADGAGVILYPNYYAKVADNNSAVPQDRVFVNYRFFNDVDTYKSFAGAAGDQARDLSVIEFGLEKTILDGLVSFDLILPFANTPNNDFSFGGPSATPAQHLELQDLAFGMKVLLSQGPEYAFSTGVRFEAPTYDPIVDITTPGFNVDNDVWAVTPYLAYLRYLSEKTYFQSFAAYRFQTSENGDNAAGGGRAGYREPGYLNLDAQLGHWLIRKSGAQGLTGLQAKAELHYTGTFERVEPFPFGPNIISIGGEHDVWNATAGLTALFNDSTTVTLAGVLPIRNGSSVIAPGVAPFPSDRIFDWELIFQVNHYFGN